MPDDNRKVQGCCPLGCGETLILAAGGYVTCSRLDCPRPDAATDILADRETEHVVTFSAAGFIIRHPLRERLDDALMTCALHEWCEGLDGPPVQLGRYRATRQPGRPWRWEALDG
jgi:hypothetical protein